MAITWNVFAATKHMTEAFHAGRAWLKSRKSWYDVMLAAQTISKFTTNIPIGQTARALSGNAINIPEAAATIAAKNQRPSIKPG